MYNRHNSITSTINNIHLYTCTYTTLTIRPGTLFPFGLTPQWILNVRHADLEKEQAGLPQDHLAQYQ